MLDILADERTSNRIIQGVLVILDAEPVSSIMVVWIERILSRVWEVSVVVQWSACVLLFSPPFVDVVISISCGNILYFLNSALMLLNPSRNLAGLYSLALVITDVDLVVDCVQKCREFLNPDQRSESLILLKNLGECGKHAARNPDTTSMSDHKSRME